MASNPLEDPRQYLFDFLQEEFERLPQVRLRIVPLAQDDGVSAKTPAREYFFETDWIRYRRFGEVRALVEKIKEVL